ncbi:hypothetical protein EVAR_26395_1 [Eumeta japonica]|uniref:Uncharacterized protein n=1 Tax=Eumeta variegata TaxID=151549 RepID=A0A4C1VQR6_EUMVA|nr:hypothetical protein EVAR_26395_1 [Eumeta japonica]
MELGAERHTTALLDLRSAMRQKEPCCARGRPIIVEWERDARHSAGLSLVRLRLGVTLKSVTLGNVTMSHRTRESPPECLASLSHSTMIGLPRAH